MMSWSRVYSMHCNIKKGTTFYIIYSSGSQLALHPRFCSYLLSCNHLSHYTFASHVGWREYELEGCNRSHRTSDSTGVVFTCSCGTFACRVHDSGHLVSERVTWVILGPFGFLNSFELCTIIFWRNTPSSACRV